MSGWLNSLWQKLRSLLMFIGRVNSILLLTIFYYLILGPVAVLYRVAKLFYRSAGDQSSYWLDRGEEVETEETLLRQF